MLEFQLNVKFGVIPGANPVKTANKLLSELSDNYGYAIDHEIEYGSSKILRMSIRKNGMEYINVVESMGWYVTPLFISELARFVELNHVQAVLHELVPRMATFGLDIELTPDKQQISVAKFRDGSSPDCNELSRRYPATYGGMLQLRHDVDVAEVDYLIESHLPEMLKRGWRYRRSDDCHNIIIPDKDERRRIGYDNVDAVKQLITEQNLRTSKSKLKVDEVI